MDDKMNKKHHEDTDKTHHENVKKDTADKKMPGKETEHDHKKAGKDECCDCGTSSKNTMKDKDRQPKK